MSEDATPTVRNDALLGLAQSWLPVLTAVFGALWGLYTYLAHERTAAEEAARNEDKLKIERVDQAIRDNRTRTIEAQKPFLDKQLGLYFETAQVVGRLVTGAVGSDAWQKDDVRFWQLYWSELTMVEHTEVAAGMVAFSHALEPVEALRASAAAVDASDRQSAADTASLQQPALQLARALRRGVEKSWGNATGIQDSLVAPYEPR